MLQPPSQSATDKLSAEDFAKFFVDNVAKIRASTAAAAAPVIIPRDVLPLTELEPTSVHEITSCCPRCLQSPALWTQYPLGCSSASQLLFVQ